MAASLPFVDTNVLLYALSDDLRKAERCEALLRDGVVIGVQVLNEFVNVARRKRALSWAEIDDALGLLRARCTVRDLTVAIHDEALVLSRRFRLAWYDALIVAAAIDAGSRVLFSEDMHDGLQVTARLVIRNPFASA